MHRDNQALTMILQLVGRHLNDPHQLCCLLALLAFKLSFLDNEKEKLASLSVFSRRATKRASCSLDDTETELGGRCSRATTLLVER